jgi:type IV pilus assembly protein PilW
VLVALVLTLGLMAAGLTISFSARSAMVTDQHRTAINQNLRAGMDLLGLDIRQAGERLPADVPVIEILDGSGAAPDTLILRRNLLSVVLPLCDDISAGTSTDHVVIADGVAPIPAGCDALPDANSDGWPDNMEVWRDYRIENGGQVLAYIYNPASQVGEYFEYDAEDSSGLKLHRSNGDPWQHDYAVTDQARVYILEQRTFRLVDDILQCKIDSEGSAPLSLVDHIEGFQLRAFLSDGSIQESLGSIDDWTDLESIEVALSAESQMKDRTMDRQLTTRFFPRNILSR